MLFWRIGSWTAAMVCSAPAKLADQIPAAAAVDDVYDLLSGSAGAIAPLLMLASKNRR